MKGYEYSWYLPTDVYQDMVASPGVMSYAFNVRDGGEEEMEAFLQDYTEYEEPVMNYSSKFTRETEFEDTRHMLLAVAD